MSCFHKIILTARAQPNIGSRAVQSPPGEVKIFQSFRSNPHLSLICPQLRQVQSYNRGGHWAL